MKHTPGALIGPLLLLLVTAAQAATIEHPGVLSKGANCSSCHANKTEGKSVHSAMALPCTVCHLTETQGDMTTLNLFMPKGTICFACHEKSAQLQCRSPGAKACVECHDSHSSSRPALLREQVDVLRP
ncbi:MAG: cytochrome c3 family protein [Terriglobales bacterium]